MMAVERWRYGIIATDRATPLVEGATDVTLDSAMATGYVAHGGDYCTGIAPFRVGEGIGSLPEEIEIDHVSW